MWLRRLQQVQNSGIRLSELKFKFNIKIELTGFKLRKSVKKQRYTFFMNISFIIGINLFKVFSQVNNGYKKKILFFR